jgi:long-subunit acyl-CoA synthetase (AMP-forming)
VETLYLVPSLLRLIGDRLEEAAEALENVKTIWTGASAVRPELQSKVSQGLKGRPTMCHSYGMTETTFTVFAGPSRKDKPGSCGSINPGFHCMVLTLAVICDLGEGGEVIKGQKF